jgi:phosphoribosylglycinamide formyltransferase-1
MKVKIAVLASGRGSNLQAIVKAIKAGSCDAEVKVVITNNYDAAAITIARENSISVELIERKSFKSREDLDNGIKELLDKYEVDIAVLAGYMLILKGKSILEAYRNRILNIHPSILPAFPGVDAPKQAFDHGCKVSGFTIHFVDESLDGGPIIYQEAVDISACKDGDAAGELILKREHEAYSKVIHSFSRGKYVVEGRHVRFIEK